MTIYTFETASPGWTEQTNNFGIATAHNTSGTICSQQGYFNNSPALFGGSYYNETVIQSDAAIDAESISVYFNAQNGDYGGGYLNQVTIKWANSSSGPWTGGSSNTYGSVTNIPADGCQSLTFTESQSAKYFRIYVNVNGPTAAVESYIYKLEVTAASGTLILSLAADFDYLYSSNLESGTFTLNRYDHSTLSGTALYTFGSASDSDITAGTNALKLAVVPASASTIYAWGYDGNGVQVNKSTDDGGTFTDVSGDWGSAVVTAFEINQFNPADIVATLNNDDIYRSTDGAATWAKTGDGPGADITTAERHPFLPSAIMAANSTAGGIDVTGDYGVNWEAGTISGGGTVTAIKKAL